MNPFATFEILPFSAFDVLVRYWDSLAHLCIDYTAKYLFFAMIHNQEIYDKLSGNNSSQFKVECLNPLSVQQ